MYFIRFVLFCTDSVNDFLSANGPYLAGTISFYALFSFFPLVLSIISVTGFVIGSEEQASRLASDIADVLPVSSDYMSDTVQGVVNTRAITGIAGAIGLLWASSAAFGAIRKGVNAAWGIRKTRPFLRERFMDFGLVLGAGLLIVVIMFTTPIIAFFREVTDTLAPETDLATDYFWLMVPQIVTPLLSFLTFLTLYRFLPNTKVKLGDVWLGALLGSAIFEGAKLGFIWYVKTFPIYNAVYGPVGAIMALLTWIYVSAIILLFGALLTSKYAAYSARVTEERGIKLLWTGLSRVRIRVVSSTEAG